MIDVKKTLIIPAIVFAAIYGLQFIVTESFNGYIQQLIVYCCINITLAVSLNLINGFTGQFSIGHAGFMAVGAYSSAYFSVNQGAKIAAPLGGGALGGEVALLLATLLGAVIAAGARFLRRVPALRR